MGPSREARPVRSENGHEPVGAASVVSIEALMSAVFGLGLAGLFTALNLALGLAQATPLAPSVAEPRDLSALELEAGDCAPPRCVSDRQGGGSQDAY